MAQQRGYDTNDFFCQIYHLLTLLSRRISALQELCMVILNFRWINLNFEGILYASNCIFNMVQKIPLLHVPLLNHGSVRLSLLVTVQCFSLTINQFQPAYQPQKPSGYLCTNVHPYFPNYIQDACVHTQLFLQVINFEIDKVSTKA